MSSPWALGWPVEPGCSHLGLGAMPLLPEPSWSPEAARERGTAAPPARWWEGPPGWVPGPRPQGFASFLLPCTSPQAGPSAQVSGRQNQELKLVLSHSI